MCDNVMEWRGVTRNPLDPAKVLAGTLNDAELESVLIIGRRRGGGLYVATSDPRPENMLMLVRVADQMLARTLEDVMDGDDG